MKNTQIFQPLFICPNLIMKTVKHCAKYVQSKTKNKFCKTKCVKLNFYKCVNFLLSWLLWTLWICHFHCFPTPFLLLCLRFHLDSLHRHPDFPHLSHFHTDSRARFQKNSYFSSKTNTTFCYYCITLGIKSLFTSSETSSVISQKKNP